MPSPTDLVTDLPADFEVFGQAVDTDFVDLLGGANGYILSKASATDLDFAWIPNDQGDITAVNVTAPITGGGTAGAVTIGINAATTSVVGAVQLSDSTSTTSSVLASTPTATKAAYDLANTANTAAGAAQTTANNAIAKSTVTTAGDIIYRNATVPTRLGIGTAGQVLQVNSGATAPEWATAASGGLTLLSTTNITATTTQTISSIPTTNKHLFIYIENFSNSTGSIAWLRCNSDATAAAHRFFRIVSSGSTISNDNAATKVEWGTNGFQQNAAITIYNSGSAFYKPIQVTTAGADQSAFVAGEYKSASTVTSILFDYAGTAAAQGTIKIYGVN